MLLKPRLWQFGFTKDITKMSTNFSTSLDSFTNPGPNDAMNASPALDHDVQHGNENDAISALEAKVGVDGSLNTSCIDFKIRKGSFIRQPGLTQLSSSLGIGATSSITYSSSPPATPPLGKGCIIVQVTTSCGAWVRIYASLADQTADSSRTIGTDPVAGKGVLLEVITAGTSPTTIDLSPMIMVASLESSPGTTLPMTITNESGIAQSAITVTLTTIPVEG
jgi:hypothetical protein